MVPNSSVQVMATPSQHFSGRTPKMRNATLWSSFVVRSERHCVFFSGDTGLTSEYRTIRERIGPFDLAMLEIGAWDRAWGDMHLGPDNAIKALAHLDAKTFLPIHWGTFRLAMHPWDQPAEVLYEKASKNSARFLMPKLGAPVEPEHASGAVEPWWRSVDRGLTPQVQPISEPAERALPQILPWPID